MRARLSKLTHEASTRLNRNESSRPVSSDNEIPRTAKTERPTADSRVSATRATTNGQSDVFGLSDPSRTKTIYLRVIHVSGAYFAANTAK